MSKKNLLSKVQTNQVLDAMRKDEDADIATLLVEAFTPESTSADERQAPAAPTLTDQHLEAMIALPAIFGKVTPSQPRLLTEEEQVEVIKEREIIDTLLSVLKERKDNSLRETLANHLDLLAEEEGLVDEDTPKDKKGHYYIPMEAPVPGTGKKIQKIVSGPAPKVDSAKLLDLYEAGEITREEYLSLTKVPEVARVFDPVKARKAIRKNPALLGVLAQATTRPNPTITIKVAPHRSA